MNDWEKWWGRVRDIHASGMIRWWWWWWWYVFNSWNLDCDPRVSWSFLQNNNHQSVMKFHFVNCLMTTPWNLGVTSFIIYIYTHTYMWIKKVKPKKDIDTWLMKAWTAIDRLSVIWKLDLTDNMKRSFFQAAVVSILLYGCTTWMLTKRLEKKLDDNYTRMLRAILNKFWRQHSTRHQLYSHLPPIAKTIQVRWTRHAGHC